VPADELTVDVILPTHAGERWVGEAIGSVVRQSHSLWQLMVVDDCSPDATAERVESLLQGDPDRISLLRLDRPHRAAGARMRGIARTSGDLIAFLDQDDCWLPEKLARQVACFAADPALAAVHTDVEIIDAEGAPRVGAADRENARRARIAWGSGSGLSAVLFQKNSIRLASSVVRRTAFEAIGGFDTSLFGGEDWEFWVRLADRFPIAHLPEVLTQRRVHADNVSKAHSLERSAGKLQALEKMKRSYRQVAPLAAAKRAQLLREATLAATSQRRPVQASRYAVSLVTHRLRSLLAPSPRGDLNQEESALSEAERGKGG
jgi:glycosyltransferase involved in cell wall biosynthesis